MDYDGRYPPGDYSERRAWVVPAWLALGCLVAVVILQEWMFLLVAVAMIITGAPAFEYRLRLAVDNE